MSIVSFAENQKISLSWGNYSSIENVSILLSLSFNWIIYLIISLYLEQISPGTDEASLSYFFFLSPSYWKSFFKNEMKYQPIDEESGPILTQDREGIIITNLSKEFTKRGFFCNKTSLLAVDNVSFEIPEGKIFALLGHNGAGKSTTIQCINGVLQPTTGKITFNNLDTSIHMDEIRSNLGVCPQETLIFENLTAKEHLMIFGVIRGIPFKDIDETISKLITQVGLSSDCLNEYLKNFSGGMKRKIAIASKINIDLFYSFIYG